MYIYMPHGDSCTWANDLQHLPKYMSYHGAIGGLAHFLSF